MPILSRYRCDVPSCFDCLFSLNFSTSQEVETEQYTKLFLPDLESRGYAGIFSPKSRAKTMNEEERKHVDGCAIFWKVDKCVHSIDHTRERSDWCIAADLSWSRNT